MKMKNIINSQKHFNQYNFMKTSNKIRIDWKQAKELVTSGKMTAIGSNLGQIHPSGEYSISADGKSLYKRRTGMPFDDKIATAN